jgi:hypothetical protein
MARAATRAGLVALAVALLFGRVPLSFDTYFALLDGRDFANGRVPDFDLGVASTPHPLYEAVAALLAPLGEGAEPALWVLALLSFGAVCAAGFELAKMLGGLTAGVLAFLVLATRPVLLEVAARASVDMPALALVLWALVLALRAPRRGTPALVLLALAGLLRPEAWLLALAYAVWIGLRAGARERVRLALLAVAAPLLWVAHDVAFTGDPLFTRDHTADTVANSYKTGVDGLAEVPRHVASILGVAGCAAAVAGLVLVWMCLRARARAREEAERVVILLAVLVLSGASAVALAVGGQPILQRFFLLPAAVLVVLGAAAAARAPRRALVPLVILALIPFAVPRIGELRTELRADQRLQSELRDLVDGGPARAAVEDCRPAHITAGGILPTLAFELDLPPEDLAAPAPGRATVATLPAAANDDLPYPLAPPAPPPSGQAEVARSERWVVYRGCR